MNGRVMPVAGNTLRLTPDVADRLQAEVREQPARGEQGEPVGHQFGALQPAQGDEAEQTEQRDARDQAELLGDHREHEVAVSIRQQILDAPLAGTAAEPGGAAHCLERVADLVVIAGGGIDEAVDPLGDVGEEVIGLPHAGERRPRPARTPSSRAARRGTAGSRTASRPSAPCRRWAAPGAGSRPARSTARLAPDCPGPATAPASRPRPPRAPAWRTRRAATPDRRSAASAARRWFPARSAG